MSNFASIKTLAMEKAIEAVHQGRPKAARVWTEVAAIADAASHNRYPPPGLPQSAAARAIFNMENDR